MGMILVTKKHTLCKFHHLSYWCLLFWSRINPGPHLAFHGHVSLVSSLHCSSVSPIIQPGHFWRVLVSYFKDCLSIWVWLIFSHDYTFGASISMQCYHVPLLSHSFSFRGEDSEAHRRVDCELQNPDVKIGVWQTRVCHLLSLFRTRVRNTLKRNFGGCQCESLLNIKLTH